MKVWSVKVYHNGKLSIQKEIEDAEMPTALIGLLEDYTDEDVPGGWSFDIRLVGGQTTMGSEERKCDNCGIERFLERSIKIVPRMQYRLVEDAVRCLYCLGCVHYSFETDNWQPREE